MHDTPRRLPFLIPALMLAVTACSKKEAQQLRIETTPVARRTIVVEASASGSVEPINVVEVKSKSSGQITKMTVETGSRVSPGDLLVQLDTRDVQNQYDQAAADENAAKAKLSVSEAQKKRSDDLAQQRIITATEHETAQLDYANAQASVIRARTSLDLARQRLEDATVKAPVGGTIIEKTVALGQVITSATSGASGGTTILKMADLTRVRMRALFNETDIGSVQPGQTVRVTVDAYPDRPFFGNVEKIEPQAVVQQSVTMFPVLVNLDNQAGMLKPGMNGEATVTVDRKENVLVVPNDALRTVREARTAAGLVGLNPDTVQAQVQAQMGTAFGGGSGGERPAAPPSATVTVEHAHGEVDLAPAAAQQGGQRGPGGFGGQMPQVSDADCAKVTSAMTKQPDVAQKLQALRGRMQSGELDFQAMRAESDKLYASLGVEANVARACQFRDRAQAGGGAGAGVGGAPGGATAAGANPMGGRGSAAQTSPGGAQGGASARGSEAAAGQSAGGFGGQRTPSGGGRTRARTSIVFVQAEGAVSPRVIRVGAADFDYTEVVSGLKEGEAVVMLAAAAAQAARDSMNNRFRQMGGGGIPGMQRTPAGGTATPAPGGGMPGRRP